VRHVSHALRGSSATLGAVRLAAVLGEVEAAAAAGDVATASARLALVREEHQRAARALAAAFRSE
jgi:HPt (histidine-containing phosphotransfer) domain-containing protein